MPDPFGFERMFGPDDTPHPRRRNGARSQSPLIPPIASTAQDFAAGRGPPRVSKQCSNRSGGSDRARFVFLLHTVGMFEFAIDRFWPMILIAFGAWLFARRWGLLGTDGHRVHL